MKNPFPVLLYSGLCLTATWCLMQRGVGAYTFSQNRAIAEPFPADTLRTTDTTAFACDTSGLKTIAGYRFTLKGDFNGDGKTDVLTERFTDHSGRELGKYFLIGGEVYTDQCLEALRKPVQFFAVKGFKADTLFCPFLLFAQNLGDLDGNGTDEVGLVSHHNDYSSCTGFWIYTLRKKHWEPLLCINAWEWMFPPTPLAASLYYPFGHLKDTMIESDSLNRVLEKQLADFSFVKKVRNNVIVFSMRNDSIDNAFSVPADMITLRYNLQNRTFKVRLDQLPGTPEALEALDTLPKPAPHEYLVNGIVYYLE